MERESHYGFDERVPGLDRCGKLSKKLGVHLEDAVAVFELLKMPTNKSAKLFDKLGVHLEDAVDVFELLMKEMDTSSSSSKATNTDMFELNAQMADLKARELELQADRAGFKAAKAKLEEDMLQLEAEKTQFRVAQIQLKAAQSQLEDAKRNLESAQTQLKEDRGQLEIARKHLEAAKTQTDITNTRLAAAKQSLDAEDSETEEQERSKEHGISIAPIGFVTPDSPVHTEPLARGASSSAQQLSVAANSEPPTHPDPPNEDNTPLGTIVDFPPGTKLINGFVVPGTLKTFYGTKVPSRLLKRKCTTRPAAQLDTTNSSPAQPTLANSASTQNIVPPPPLSLAPMAPLSQPSPANSLPPAPPMPPLNQPTSLVPPDSPILEPPVVAKVPKRMVPRQQTSSRLAASEVIEVPDDSPTRDESVWKTAKESTTAKRNMWTRSQASKEPRPDYAEDGETEEQERSKEYGSSLAAVGLNYSDSSDDEMEVPPMDGAGINAPAPASDPAEVVGHFQEEAQALVDPLTAMVVLYATSPTSLTEPEVILVPDDSPTRDESVRKTAKESTTAKRRVWTRSLASKKPRPDYAEDDEPRFKKARPTPSKAKKEARKNPEGEGHAETEEQEAELRPRKKFKLSTIPKDVDFNYYNYLLED